jgi:hypothetical protein
MEPSPGRFRQNLAATRQLCGPVLPAADSGRWDGRGEPDQGHRTSDPQRREQPGSQLQRNPVPGSRTSVHTRHSRAWVQGRHGCPGPRTPFQAGPGSGAGLLNQPEGQLRQIPGYGNLVDNHRPNRWTRRPGGPHSVLSSAANSPAQVAECSFVQNRQVGPAGRHRWKSEM